jgi:hypothetical protein
MAPERSTSLISGIRDAGTEVLAVDCRAWRFLAIAELRKRTASAARLHKLRAETVPHGDLLSSLIVIQPGLNESALEIGSKPGIVEQSLKGM